MAFLTWIHLFNQIKEKSGAKESIQESCKYCLFEMQASLSWAMFGGSSEITWSERAFSTPLFRFV